VSHQCGSATVTPGRILPSGGLEREGSISIIIMEQGERENPDSAGEHGKNGARRSLQKSFWKGAGGDAKFLFGGSQSVGRVTKRGNNWYDPHVRRKKEKDSMGLSHKNEEKKIKKTVKNRN